MDGMRPIVAIRGERLPRPAWPDTFQVRAYGVAELDDRRKAHVRIGLDGGDENRLELGATSGSSSMACLMPVPQVH